MVSLKQYKKTEIIEKLKQIASKTAMVLDDDDIAFCLERSIGKLNEVMFDPRCVIFDNEHLTTKNGSVFVDVTSFKMDVINTVYYAKNESDNFLSSATLGIGFFPWLSSITGVSFLSDVTGYLILQGNLNALNRQLTLVDDYELWPTDSDGRQLLQIRSDPQLFICEYLPFIDSEDDSWYLYNQEYQLVLEYTRCLMYQRNQEAVASASSLGFGKDALSLVQYWEKQADKALKDFTDHTIITYRG